MLVHFSTNISFCYLHAVELQATYFTACCTDKCVVNHSGYATAPTEQLIRTVGSEELYLEQFWNHHQLSVTPPLGGTEPRLHGKSFNAHVDKDDTAWALSAYGSLCCSDQLNCPGSFQRYFFLYIGLLISINRIVELEGINSYTQ